MLSQGYYFEVEKRGDNLLTFAYIWRAGDDATTAPPVKSFHSALPDDEAERKVSNQAAKWIEEHPPQGKGDNDAEEKAT